MDPSVLLKQRGVKWDDPLDDYTKLRSLRDLMDQRRFREQQYQMHQLQMQENARKAQWDMEDRQRAMNLSDLLTKNPDAPFPAIVGVAGIAPALKIETERRQKDKAVNEAAIEKLKRDTEQKKRYANAVAAINLLPPADRQGAWDDLHSGIAVDQPPSQAQEQSLFADAYGPKDALELSEARRKAASAAVTDPYQQQKIIDEAEGVRSKRTGVKLFKSSTPAEWDRNIQELPEAERAQWIGVPFTPANRYKALTLGQTPTEILTQQQRATPSNAKELILHMNRPDATPEEKAIDAKALEQMQAYDVAVAEATAGAKPMSAESSKVYAVAQSLIPEARLLQEAIRTGGRKALLQIMTKSDPKLARLADSVADKVGRLRSGGAVNAGEEARFMAQLARWADLLGDDADMSAPLDAIERLIGEAGTVAGGMRPGQKAPDSNAPVQPGTYPNPIAGAPPVNIPATPGFSPAGSAGKKAIPNVGTVRKDNDGNERVFIGGDPNNKGNWPVRGK